MRNRHNNGLENQVYYRVYNVISFRLNVSYGTKKMVSPNRRKNFGN